MSVQTINLISLLEKASPEERRGLLTKYIDLFIREMLDILPDEDISHDSLFTEIGLDSISAVNLKDTINKSLGGKIDMGSEKIFDYPTINKLARYIGNELGLEGLVDEEQKELVNLEGEHVEKEEAQAKTKEEIVEELKRELDDE